MKLLLTISLFFSLFAQKQTTDDEFDVFTRGFNAVLKKDWKAAEHSMTQLLKDFPKSQYAWKAQLWKAYAEKRTGKYHDAFESFRLVFANYSVNEEIEKTCKTERIYIALAFQDHSKLYKDFIRYGGDYTDEIVMDKSKEAHYKKKLDSFKKKETQIFADLKRLKSDKKTSKTKLRRLYKKLEELSENIAYTSKIHEKISKKLNYYASLLEETSVDEIIKRYTTLNKNYFILLSLIKDEKWTIALKLSKQILSEQSESKFFYLTLFWENFVNQQLAIENKDYGRLKVAFVRYRDIIKSFDNNDIIFESKINRVIIAHQLAAHDRDYKRFLERGADFNVELRQVYRYLTQISNPNQIKNVSKLFKFDTVSLAMQTIKSGQAILDKAYSEKFVKRINQFASTIQAYYGNYQINLNHFAE